MKKNIRQLLLALNDSFLISIVIFVSPIAWIVRDGLGPNAVDSQGLDALWRWFGTFWHGPLLIVMVISSLLLRKFKNNAENKKINL